MSWKENTPESDLQDNVFSEEGDGKILTNSGYKI